jgi:hypothetical protein
VIGGRGLRGDVLVDCLFGTGLSRGLDEGDLALLTALAARHAKRIAIDLPSGIADRHRPPLNEGLPDYLLTIALGAWKPAHLLMPAAARMGALRLVDRLRGDGWRGRSSPGPNCAHRRPIAQIPARSAGRGGGRDAGRGAAGGRRRAGRGAGLCPLLSEAPLPPTAHVPADLVLARPDLAIRACRRCWSGRGWGAMRRRISCWPRRWGGCPVVADADALMLLAKGCAPPSPRRMKARWWRWSGISGWTMARPRSTARWRWRGERHGDCGQGAGHGGRRA